MTLPHPVFVDGQTLTHDALNDLRKFVENQDQQLGQLVGFGISCGLEVDIDGDTLIVRPGLAIDQLGRAIVVEEELKIGLATPSSEFDWLERSPEGRTVVLTLEESIEDAPDCEEDGCTRHASTRRVTPVLRLADGCLAPKLFRLDDSELRGINAIAVNKSSRPSNQGAGLRSAVLRAMSTRGFPRSVLTKFGEISLASTELPGASAYKAGFLNQVFFAMIEFLRCETLTQAPCFRDSRTPGVALGCLVDGEWRCDNAHHWSPPAGLARALLGGGCEDPCRFHRRRIISMIENFVIPEFPDPTDQPRPGGGGPYRICRHRKGLRALGAEFQLRQDCVHIEAPDLRTPDLTFFETVPDVYVDPAVDITLARDVYGRFKDPIEAGLIDITGALGHGADAAAGAIRETILESEGGDFGTQIITITEGEASRLDGYVPASDAAITDQIVLVRSATGMVTATGRVPVNKTLHEVGPSVSELTTETESARAAASAATTQVTAIATELAAVDDRTAELQGLINGSGDTKGLAATVAEIDGSVNGLRSEFETFGGSVGRAELEAELGAIQATIDLKIAEATLSIDDAVSKSVGELRVDLDTKTAALRTDFQTQTSATVNRIDDVLVGQKLVGRTTGDLDVDRGAVVGSSIINAFREMATAIESASAPGAREAVRRDLDVANRSIARMEAAAELGGSVPSVAGGEIVSAFERMAAATETLGLPARDMTRLKRSIEAVRTELRL